MKRPIVVATIGYIIGIIVGLYFKISIVPFYIPIIAIYVIYKNYHKPKTKKVKLLSIRRYLKYIKIYLNKKIFIMLVISSIISNSIVNFQNNEYEKIYNNLEKEERVQLTGIIISEKQEKDYYNKYKIKTKIDNKKINIYITVSKDIRLEYGDKIVFTGTYSKPEVQRNYKGFDYSQYLKQIKVYGTVKCEKARKIDENQGNKIFKISNNLRKNITEESKKILDNNTSSILLGLILGDKTDINENTQENFKNASMSHILAVSGMHVAYVILGINLIFKRIIGKRKTDILNILILIFYMFITNFSPSITRAGIMGILVIFSKIIYRKNDIYTSISISLILILIYNPFLIQNLGLLLSYGGVLGIITLNKNILKIFKSIKIKNKIYKHQIRPKIQKYIDKIEEIISISLSVQIFILPIILYNLNTFNPYFLISNLILSIVCGPITILGFIFIVSILINIKVAQIISIPIKFAIKILILISKIGKMPLSKIYIATPSLFWVIIYYLVIAISFFIYDVYSNKKPNKTQIRIKNLIAILKIKLRRNKNKIKKILLILILILIIIKFIPKNLKIYFIDVGQGDSTLIITPHNKKILIDGGGSISSNFDVGKNTLIPYILDRGITKIDIVIISHFDFDHVGRSFNIIRRIKSRKSIYSKTNRKI